MLVFRGVSFNERKTWRKSSQVKVVFSFPIKALKGAWCFPMSFFFWLRWVIYSTCGMPQKQKKTQKLRFFQNKKSLGLPKCQKLSNFTSELAEFDFHPFFSAENSSELDKPVTDPESHRFFGRDPSKWPGIGIWWFCHKLTKAKKKQLKFEACLSILIFSHPFCLLSEKITSFWKTLNHSIFVEATRFGFWSSKLLEDQPVLYTPLSVPNAVTSSDLHKSLLCKSS